MAPRATRQARKGVKYKEAVDNDDIDIVVQPRKRRRKGDAEYEEESNVVQNQAQVIEHDNDEDTKNSSLHASHPTLPVLPGYKVGFILQTSLFFASEQWVRPLQADVDDLVQSFVEAWTTRSHPPKSPFEVFRQSWERLGWTHVHLLGVADGPIRRPWGLSVLRAFIEHLRPDEQPLKQVAALFAIHAFIGSQARTMQQVYAHADPPTLEYILTLPERLSPALDTPMRTLSEDTSKDTPVNSTVPPSLDLAVVLRTLLMADSFMLVPTETFLHPPLPSVGVREARATDVDNLAKKVLSVEDEVAFLSSGRLEGAFLETRQRVMETAGRLEAEQSSGGTTATAKKRPYEAVPAVYQFQNAKRVRRGSSDGPERDTVESDADRRKWWDDDKGWLSNLRELKDSYVVTRDKSFPDTTSTTGESGLGRQDTNDLTLTEQIFAQAELMTRRALENVGRFGGEQGNQNAEFVSASHGQPRLELPSVFGLIKQRGETDQARNRATRDATEVSLQGLEAYLQAVGELKEADAQGGQEVPSQVQ